MKTRLMSLLLTAVVAIFALPDPGMADCEFYQEYARVIGEHVGEAYHNGVMIHGAHALTYGYGGQLSIYDLGDPSRPSFDGIIPESGSVTAAILDGTVVMVGKRVGQMYYFDSLDIETLEAPIYHAEVAIPARAHNLVRSGEHVYMATETGLVIVNAADLDHPRIVAGLALGGVVEDVAVEGDHAYCTVSSVGLVIVDVSDPSMPWIASTFPMIEILTTKSVIADSGLAYVGAYEGLYIIDVSSPSAPALIHTFHQVPIEDMLLEGSLLYIASGGLSIVDVSTPTEPVVVGRPGSGFLYCLDKSGDMVVTGGNAGDLTGHLQVVDVTVPVTVMPEAAIIIPGDPWDLVRQGAYVFAASGQLGVVVVDISDPLSPAVVGLVGTPGEAQGIACVGSYLFVADSAEGLTVVDISVPTSPELVASLPLSGPAGKVLASGDYAYVLTWDDLVIIDIMDPTAPRIVAEAEINTRLLDLDRMGDLLLIAAADQGLHIVDVSDPTLPVIAATIAPGTAESEIWGVTAHGNYAFLVDYHRTFYTYRGAELRVYDLVDPASPVEAGVLAVPTLRGPIAVDAGVAYLASDVRLVAVDVSDPSAPVERGAAGSLAAWPKGIVFLEDYVCTVGGQMDYFEVFPRQCSNPADVRAPLSAAAAMSARPNPFTRSSTLSFACGTCGSACVTIHDAVGRLVRRLDSADPVSGMRTLEWDGHDEDARPVPPGVYFTRRDDAPGATLRLIRLTGR